METFSKIVTFYDKYGKSHSMFCTYERKEGDSEYKLIPEHKKLYEAIKNGGKL